MSLTVSCEQSEVATVEGLACLDSRRVLEIVYQAFANANERVVKASTEIQSQFLFVCRGYGVGAGVTIC